MDNSHYAVLGVTSTATPDEVRAAYKALALKHHPDRTKTVHSADIFARISEAWSVLSDPIKRSELDRTTSIKKFGPITETVLLTDLDTTEEPSVYTKSCRCGDVFEVYQSELDDGLNCVQCNGCSLHITVISA